MAEVASASLDLRDLLAQVTRLNSTTHKLYSSFEDMRQSLTGSRESVFNYNEELERTHDLEGSINEKLSIRERLMERLNGAARLYKMSMNAVFGLHHRSPIDRLRDKGLWGIARDITSFMSNETDGTLTKRFEAKTANTTYRNLLAASRAGELTGTESAVNDRSILSFRNSMLDANNAGTRAMLGLTDRDLASDGTELYFKGLSSLASLIKSNQYSDQQLFDKFGRDFGIDSFQQFIALKDVLPSLVKSYKEMQGFISYNDRALAQSESALKKLGYALDNVRKNIASALSPAFNVLTNLVTKLTNKFLGFLKSSGALDKFSKWAKSFADSVNFESLFDSLQKAFYVAIDFFSDELPVLFAKLKAVIVKLNPLSKAADIEAANAYVRDTEHTRDRNAMLKTFSRNTGKDLTSDFIRYSGQHYGYNKELIAMRGELNRILATKTQDTRIKIISEVKDSTIHLYAQPSKGNTTLEKVSLGAINMM